MQRERYLVLEPIHEPGKCAQGLMSLTDYPGKKKNMEGFSLPFVHQLFNTSPNRVRSP